MKYVNNLKRLEIFKEVVSSGSISRAANLLGLTQPAVSSTITNLEAELGFSLFKRTNTGTLLTPEAIYLMTAVEKLLSSANDFDELVHEVRYGRAGKLHVGCMPGFPSTLVPKILSRLIQQHPRLNVSLKICESTKVQDGVRSGHFDIGIAELPYNDRELKVFALNYDLVVILPSSHALAEKECIEIKDLDNEPFISLDEHHFLSHEIKNRFIKEQCNLNIIAEAHLFSSISLMVAEGLGLSLVDMITAKKLLDDTNNRVVMKPFKPTIHLPIGILLSKSKHISKSVLLLNQILEEELSALSRVLESS